ncbi:MAG: hypothetical protein IPH07_24575 [Deltaproteobacteria bacterium]|nr:hypothetical protein [Deltaproteobacteria bacterium]
MQQPALRPAIRPEAGLRIKQARLRARMRQYQLGMAIGFRSQRSAQEIVHAIETGRTAWIVCSPPRRRWGCPSRL